MLFYGIRKRFNGAYVYRFNSSSALRNWVKKKCNAFVATAADYFVRRAKRLLKETFPARKHAAKWLKGVKIRDTRPVEHE